ncbi:TPR end-of-group domain-containing protein [Nannocystis punicea]|uniref:Sel1 repeat family protein n=1 Tax=Nannocystis punicea TaxID=2995304 RepID=A0ABY7HE56_9BACT|nr:hypothetical protein [Nannocystis poenicansa]WAS97382.1 hypothetical protein O0S08_14640 [Nannocystis poenicansa]
MIRRRVLGAVVMVLLGCRPQASATAAPEAVQTAASTSTAAGEAAPPAAVPEAEAPASVGEPALPDAPAFAAGPFEVQLGKKRPVPASQAVRKHRGQEMQDHAWAAGWTADGAAFAYCTIVSGEDCKLCTFVGMDGAKEELVSGAQCWAGKTATKLKESALRARLAERGVAVRDGTWAHGGELVVTARELLGAPDAGGQARGILKVGAARRDGTAAGEAHEVVSCDSTKEGLYCQLEAHAEVLAQSPDGQTVAILSHTWAGEWSDTFQLALMPAGRLAAAAYQQQGLDALGRQDFAAAATAFVAATHADPSAWKGPYNLACAYARAGDERARPALRLAVERGGEAVRKKAATDKDLDGVRAQAWFAATLEP